MDTRSSCILLVTLATVWPFGLPSLCLDKHMKHIIESDDIDGYDVATVHVVDTATNEERGQTKRDIEAYASDPTPDKRTFNLHLVSGKRLRMSLYRRSIDTSDTIFSEHTEKGTKEIVYKPRDCFFSGPLQDEEGYANLALCDGELFGSVTTQKRHYEVHVLPEPIDKRSADDVMRVLVTWQDAEEGLMSESKLMRQHALDRLEIPDEEPTTSEANKETQFRSLANRKVTVEIANYLDSFYLQDISRKLGRKTNGQIIDLQILKWSGAASILSDEKQIGWDINLKLSALEIWRTNPSWYNPSGSGNKIGERMNRLCAGTQKLPYDQVTLSTGQTSDLNRLGLSWIGGLCRPRWRCSAVRSSNRSFFTELHELGHSLGLNHDSKMSVCADDRVSEKGFMGCSRYRFRRCYREILNRTFTDGKKRCIYVSNTR